MIVKPTLSFLSTDSDAQLTSDATCILTAMTDNAHYLTPTPALGTVMLAWEAFYNALVDAAGGGVKLTAIKNDRRAILTGLLRELAGYVQVTCKGDMAVLLSSGFPVHKPHRQPAGVPSAPAHLTMTFGDRSGELRARAGSVAGAVIYNWKLSTAAEPNVVLQTVQTTRASNIFTGLVPGVVYCAAVNAVGSAGPGNWSVPATKMAV